MYKLVRQLMMIFTLGLSLFAQSKQETMDYLVRELKSFEKDTFLVKEVSFSGDGSILTYRTYVPTTPERKLTLPLKDVNIFMTCRTNSKGPYTYDLVVETKNRTGRFQINDRNVFGTKRIIKGELNQNRIKALEKAFSHLSMLVGDGKEPLFQ